MGRADGGPLRAERGRGMGAYSASAKDEAGRQGPSLWRSGAEASQESLCITGERRGRVVYKNTVAAEKASR